MKYLLMWLSLCSATLFTSHNTARSVDLIIRNVTIVSPELPSNVFKQDVIVDQGRIFEIGQSLKVKAKQTIDGTDLYLAPGLIDSHTHLAGVPGMSYAHIQSNPNVVKSALKQIPRSYLYHGFTTVIDLHADADEIKRWNAQKQRPTAYFCGGAPLIDGYPMNFMPEPVRYRLTRYFLTGDNKVPDGYDGADHTPQAVVKRIKADGGICVKTHFETGFGRNRDLPTPSTELIKKLKDAATAAGLPLLLHANSEDAQRFGVLTRVDGFAHGMWTWRKKGATKLDSNLRTILDQAIDQGTALQPTIQVLYGERDLHNPNYLEAPEIQNVLPRPLLTWYASDAGQQFRNEMQSTPYVKKQLMSSGWQSLNDAPITRATNVLSYWANQNGKLLFGSDTPSDMTYANPPGLNGRYEMRRWEAAGVTPAQLFSAATKANADFFGLQDEIGTVEVGKHADLLLLTADPRQDFKAYDSIQWVISQGLAIPRGDLLARSK